MVNRRAWIASVVATFFFPGLRKRDLFHTVSSVGVPELAQSVDFSNDAVWSELCTEAFATQARTTAFAPDAKNSGSPGDPLDERLVTSMARLD